VLFKRKCGSCHSLEAGKNGNGPSLHAIAGKPAGRVEGFTKYGGLIGAKFTWTDENLDFFLYDPTKFLGKLTPMMSRVKKHKDRAAIIEFLKKQ